RRRPSHPLGVDPPRAQTGRVRSPVRLGRVRAPRGASFPDTAGDARVVGGAMSAEHWDEVYATRGVDQVSWFEPDPATSLRLVEAAAPERSAAIVDVGAGASSLVDRLIDAGYVDVTLLDVSSRALETVRTRLGDRATGVT